MKENISFIAISSNDVINYPDDSPELMKKLLAKEKFLIFHIYMMNLKKLLKVLMLHVHLIFSYTFTKKTCI